MKSSRRLPRSFRRSPVVLSLLAAGVVGSHPAAAADPPTADDGIAFFRPRVERHPEDHLSRATLGGLYLRRGNERGDHEDYGRAESQFRAALALQPEFGEAALGLAAVLSKYHAFGEALTLAEAVLGRDPDDVAAMAAVGDAQFQLGRYDAAAETYTELETRRHTAPVLARLAEIAEVRGRPDEALRLLHEARGRAADAGAEGVELAWYVERIAETERHRGGRDEATDRFREVFRLDLGNRHALAGLAELAATGGDLDAAESLYWQTRAAGGGAEVYAALGDVWAARGDADAAERFYDRAVGEWLADDHADAPAGGHAHPHPADHPHPHPHPHPHGEDHDHDALPGRPTDFVARHTHSHRDASAHARSLSLFLSDHDRRPAEALRLAEENLTGRQDVESLDALAWALYRNGRFAEAADAAARALTPGVRRASFHYHAGLIDAALGRTDGAVRHLETALEIDPRFDLLHAPRARAALDELR